MFAVLASVGTLFAWDYERVQIGDLYYNLDATNQTAEVTSQNSDSPNITTADIPSSVTYNAITYSITSIGDRAFLNCSGLASVTIPNSVTSIGIFAFSGCTGLTSPVYNAHVFAYLPASYSGAYIIPDGIESIAGGAFSDCYYGLTSVTIPNSVTSIGKNAFSYCSGLALIDVASDNPYYCSVDGILFNKGKTTLIQYPAGSTRTTYEIPNSVVSIGDQAFFSCSSLTSVTIPNSVTSIGEIAIYDCRRLTSIVVDNDNPNYCSVDGTLFNKNKTTLIQYPIGNTRTTYEIPNGVTSIKGNAFYECSNLLSIMIPNSITSIGDHAFSGCGSLTSVTIPNSVTSIGEEAFNSCVNLASVTIPNNVTTIGNDAFIACYRLTSVTIPNSVTSIGNYAFSYCSGLTSITCEATTPPACGEYVFSEVNISIPLYVPAESIEAYKTADQWKDFTNIQAITKTTNAAELWPLIMDNQTYSNLEQYIVSDLRPDDIENYFYIFPLNTGELTYTANNTSGLNSCGNGEGYLALSVESFGWAGCGLCIEKQASISALQSLKEAIVTNPDNYYLHLSIKSTDSYSHCFYIMGNEATKFVLGNKSVYDGPVYSDFARDGEWHEFYIPLAQYASALDTTDIASGIFEFIALTEGVGGAQLNLDAVFFCNAEFKDGNFILPSSNKCGDNLTWSFDEQTGTLTISGSGAMYDYSYQNKAPWQDYKEAIRSIVLPNGLTTIGAWTFNECSNLSQISIPQNVTSIGDYAFVYCSSLTSVTIPNSVTSIGMSTFAACTGLTSVTIPNSVTSIGEGTFVMCESLVSVEIPSSVTSIGINTFADCTGLTSVTIPNSVTSIEQGAFFGCSSLISVTIPNSVTSIGSVAFSNCTGLTSIINYATTPQVIVGTVFGGEENNSVDKSTCILYVPSKSISLYKAADGWKEFENIVPIQASEADVTEVKVTPSATTADIAWPVVTGAASYELVIKDKDGNVICTPTFNAQGQLITLAFNAPARKHTPQQKQAAGFQFTVTGLKAGTAYDYTIVSKDENGQVLDTQNGSFTTTDTPTGIDNTPFPSCEDQGEALKILRNGQVLILRGDKTYTLTGQEVK